MTTDQLRVEIMNVYPGEKWKRKVKKMKDAQVLAIYYKMLNDGVI